MAYSEDGNCLTRIEHFSNPDVDYLGVPTGTVRRYDVARLIDENAPHVAAFRAAPGPPKVHTYHLPLLPAADSSALLGFVRLHNRSTETAEIELWAYDERGERFGPLGARLAAGHARGFDGEHLEGDREGGPFEGTIGDGEGDWRLVLRTETPIEVRAYTRSNETGFASEVHQTAALVPDSAPRAYHLPFLNPGSNLGSRGLMRVANPSGEPNTVRLEAWDDLGEPAEGPVTVTIAPQATTALTAQELEGGAAHFEGAFGDGTGKWRVRVESQDHRPLLVQGLVATRDGSLRNVSR